MSLHHNEKRVEQQDDPEKGEVAIIEPENSIQEGSTKASSLLSRLQGLITGSVEARGIQPVPLEERTDKKGTNLISLWFTANCSLLP